MAVVPAALDWSRIEADPRFQELHRRKSAFLWGLMAFSVIYYFALPIGAAYLTDLFKIKVWGVINIGYLFALSEFVVAWVIAFLITRMSSVGSLTAATVEVILGTALYLTNQLPLAYAVFIWGSVLFIVYLHRTNIQRLLAGTENRFSRL